MCMWGKTNKQTGLETARLIPNRGEWLQSGEPRWQRPEKPEARSEQQRARKYVHAKSSKSTRYEVEKRVKLENNKS